MVSPTVKSLRPSRLKEALEFRAEHKALPFAGGTDLMVRFRGYSGTIPKLAAPVLFLDALEELKVIDIEENNLRIGAGITMAELLDFSGTPELIRRAVQLIAAPALRNRATLGGNICNASPAADSLPPLYVHKARVTLVSVNGERSLSIDEFLTGPGKTALKENEILLTIEVPLFLAAGRLYYRKVGTRKANALSKLSAAGYAFIDGGTVSEFRFALGAVAPTVIRLPESEVLVKGSKTKDLDSDEILKLAEGRIWPIDDQRSTADYRKQVALNTLKEFLEQLKTTVSEAI
jgi:xanthine dehydrogenase FAD-binding subunit